MMPEYVERLLPTSDLNPVDFYFANAMTKIKDSGGGGHFSYKGGNG